MENPIYIALSRQTALQRKMDVVSNNIANMNTTGYKQQRVLFQEFLNKPALGEQMSMVEDRGTMRDMRPGPVSVTRNPLDVAISGPGYFAVQTLNGTHYTRAGHFQLDAGRRLVDGNGLPVLSDADQTLEIPAQATDIRITADGVVSTELGQIGTLKVVTFEREQLLTEVGGGLYVTDELPQAASDTSKVVQGALEQSNVQPILEMTSMIDVLRQYQSTQKLAESEHERQRNAIGKLGRVT